jgi:hypothetical protein
MICAVVRALLLFAAALYDAHAATTTPLGVPLVEGALVDPGALVDAGRNSSHRCRAVGRARLQTARDYDDRRHEAGWV